MAIYQFKSAVFILAALLFSVTQPALGGDAPKPETGDELPVKRAERPTTTGMELFSWQVKGEEGWHFALLPAPGFEKLKTAAFVMSKENTTDGIPALKKKLDALALNEKIGWFNMLDKKEPPSETAVFDFPPKEVVRELEMHCSKLKLRLNIYQASGKK